MKLCALKPEKFYAILGCSGAANIIQTLVFDGDHDIEAAYRLANARISRAEIDLRGFTRRDFTDAIKQEYNENCGLDYCTSCDNAMR